MPCIRCGKITVKWCTCSIDEAKEAFSALRDSVRVPAAVAAPAPGPARSSRLTKPRRQDRRSRATAERTSEHPFVGGATLLVRADSCASLYRAAGCAELR